MNFFLDDVASDSQPIANAIVTSIMQQPPFNPTTDPARTCIYSLPSAVRLAHILEVGASYMSIFTVCFHIVFWIPIYGGAQSLSWDYLPRVPQGEDSERRVSWKEKPIGRVISRAIHLLSMSSTSDPLKLSREDGEGSTRTTDTPGIGSSCYVTVSVEPEDNKGLLETGTGRKLHATEKTIQLQTLSIVMLSPPSPRRNIITSQTSESVTFPSSSVHNAPQHRTCVTLRELLFKPVRLSLVISLPIALVKPLKALFVDCTATGCPAWLGPDGRPVLAFVMDTGTRSR